jgi:hypothetical protein
MRIVSLITDAQIIERILGTTGGRHGQAQFNPLADLSP